MFFSEKESIESANVELFIVDRMATVRFAKILVIFWELFYENKKGKVSRGLNIDYQLKLALTNV